MPFEGLWRLWPQFGLGFQSYLVHVLIAYCVHGFFSGFDISLIAVVRVNGGTGGGFGMMLYLTATCYGYKYKNCHFQLIQLSIFFR